MHQPNKTLLKLQFLGQVRITNEDEPPIDLASEKMIALLAYLAVTEESFSRPQLEALLWGDSPPEKAQTSLRTAVYNINKRIEGLLNTTRKTVTFAPQRPFSIDTQQFQALIKNGDIDSLTTAVSLYRGDFLAGLNIADAPEFESWLLRQRERLRLDVLTTLETLVEQHINAGNYPDAIQACRQLLTIEAWRESVHRQLMLLLARNGAYNAAIKQYNQCCQMLEDELGVPPMPETEALYQRIVALRQRPPKLHLPTTANNLIGREAELAALTNHLAEPTCRLLAIIGMGGIGKTSLAMTLASQQARHFLDGVYFVSLAGLQSDALIDTAVAEALAIHFPPGVDPRTHLCAQLKAKEQLLIIDNAEHLLTAVTTFVQDLLHAAPDLKIVITSREMPRLQSAQAFPLTGLTLPDENKTAVNQSPATTLFAQQAKRIQPNFSLTTAWTDVVALCELVQGSPLGIELAAAQLDSITCADLRQQLQATVASLAVDFQDMPQRHRSLRALFQHSWQLLSSEEQDALAKLAVFRSEFTPEAAYRITETNQAVLRSLTAKSLLQAQNGRFVMHTLIRQFAQEQLSSQTAVYEQHAHYFSQQLQGIAQNSLEGHVDTLLAELDDIRAMWQFAIEHHASSILDTATHGLARLYAVTNQFVEGVLLFSQAVETLTDTAVPQEAPIMWGELLGRYAMFLFRTGQLTEARDMTERSVTILRQTDDESALAFSLNLLGILHLQSGSFTTAVPLLTECADLYRHSKNPEALLKPLINLGSVHMRLGNHDTAIAHLNEALPLAKQFGDKRGMTHILNNLGANHLILGDLVTARRHFTACLPLTEETAYHPVRLVVLQNLAEVCYKQEEWTESVAYCQASIAIAQEIGDNLQLIRTQKIHALALHALGEREQARQILCQSVQAGYEIEALAALMDVLTGVGVLLLAEGKTAVALELLQYLAVHPATEEQYVQEAKRLLAAHDITLTSNLEKQMIKRPLVEIITQVNIAVACTTM